MNNTTSIGWPNMIDVTRNSVSVYTDNASLVSRVRLLLLSDPTEMYNDITFGVGLRKYLWQYNSENVRALIRSKIVEQLKEREPCVKAEDTVFADGLLATEPNTEWSITDANKLKLTVGLVTTFDDTLTVELNSDDAQVRVDAMQSIYSSFVSK